VPGRQDGRERAEVSPFAGEAVACQDRRHRPA
jgi:hypothetical protein